MKKRLLCLFLGVAMLTSHALTSYATTSSQMQQQINQSENRLNETQEKIDALSQKQEELQGEIDAMDADLVDLMIRINVIESEIDLTEENIKVTEVNILEKEDAIADKVVEIGETQEELVSAEKDRDQQYQDMKTRIQYIYENGGNAAWINAIFSGGSLSSILNRVEYAQSMHEYDRNSLTEYMNIVDEVAALKETLENQKVDLEDQKEDLETEKVSLESQKAGLEEQQGTLKVQKANLDDKIQAKKAASDEYASQISAAEALARNISDLIEEQQEEMQRLIEEERKAEEERKRREEERKRREEEERRRQEEEERRQQQANNNSNSGSTSKPNSGSSSNSGSTSNSSKPTGAEIVAYAKQWVGNPYVWGGNSLTDGIDCSHFVWQVLKNTGAYSGSYRTSYYWRFEGEAVSSLAEAQAGDVICYDGHVAIYDGKGMIIEAKGSKWGITYDRRADYGTIYAIRRFI